SMSDYVIMWDKVLLSESISLSFMVLLIALWFWLAEGWSRQKAFLMLAVTTAWVFSRDTNGRLIVIVALLFIAIAAVQRSRRCAMFAGFCMLLFMMTE